MACPPTLHKWRMKYGWYLNEGTLCLTTQFCIQLCAVAAVLIGELALFTLYILCNGCKPGKVVFPSMISVC